MDELMFDPATAAPWLLRLPRRVPGPVGSLECSATRAGGLMFAWKKPAGSADGYRIERTRDGHEYEVIVETENSKPRAQTLSLANASPAAFRAA